MGTTIESSLENERLKDELAAKDAEIERLNSSPTIEACRQMIRDKAVEENEQLRQQLAAQKLLAEQQKEQLAASQLVIRQQREALESCIEFEKAGGFIYDIAKQAITLQPTTEALDAYVQSEVLAKFGEPVAWLKEWNSVGNARVGMWRVDLAKECEPWLENMFPSITPLYAIKKEVMR